MKTLMIATLVTAVLISPISAHRGGWCTGSPNCTTCTTCNYCKHCAKEGGTCGVCAR